MELPTSHYSMDHQVHNVQGRQLTLQDSFVLPSDQSSQHSPMMSSLSPCNTFFSGYLDCALESLRYLLEVERLPTDHPLVLGLQCQLYDTYRILHMQYEFDTHFKVGANATDVDESVKENYEISVNSNIAHPQDKHCGRDLNDEICKDVKAITGDINEHNEARANLSKYALQGADTETNKLDTGDPEIVEKLQASGLSIDAQKTALALAEQIYSLLNGDEDESDIDDTDDDESTDEGFEEMTETA